MSEELSNELVVHEVIASGQLPADRPPTVVDRIEKLAVKENDVVLFYFDPPIREACQEVVDASADWRRQHPKVTFVFLPKQANVEVITEADMNKLGWHKGNRGSSLQKGERRKFRFENGKLVKKKRGE